MPSTNQITYMRNRVLVCMQSQVKKVVKKLTQLQTQHINNPSMNTDHNKSPESNKLNIMDQYDHEDLNKVVVEHSNLQSITGKINTSSSVENQDIVKLIKGHTTNTSQEEEFPTPLQIDIVDATNASEQEDLLALPYSDNIVERNNKSLEKQLIKEPSIQDDKLIVPFVESQQSFPMKMLYELVSHQVVNKEKSYQHKR